VPFETIHKDPAAFRVPPNLASYEEECASFSWERAGSGLDGLPGGGLNIAYEAVDRHATGPRANKVALRTLDEHGQATDLQ
jgi:acetyl-CoA synthetase